MRPPVQRGGVTVSLMKVPRRQILIAAILAARMVCAESPAKRVVLMLGPPGAGKTTQSEALKTALGLPIISLEDIMRLEREGNARANNSAHRQLASGELIDDEAANAAIRTRIKQKDCRRGFILDGYPSTAKQAEYFEALLGSLRLPRPTVIHLSIPDAQAYQRLQKRGGADDSPENTERRIVQYRHDAELLLARYPDAITVDATTSPAAVADSIRKALRY